MTFALPKLSRLWPHVRRCDRETIALMLAMKAILLFLGVQTFSVGKRDYGGVLEIWNRWDASHYLHLAEFGYSSSGEERVLLAFFPMYPALVHVGAFVLRDILVSAFVVSGIASIAAALLLRRLVELDHSPAIARSAVWFFAIFPTAYFLHIPYTEGLFFAFALGCVLAARNDRWVLAGLLGACASFTRVNGLLLLPVLGLEAWSQWRDRRHFDPRWLWCLTTALGFLGYLALNLYLAGDALAFTHIQHEHWYKKLAWPWLGVADVWRRIAGENAMEGLHEFLYIAFTFACTVWAWFKLRPSYAIWMTLNWLLITSTQFVLSVPRYALTLFPIFILLGGVCAGRRLLGGIVSVFALLTMGLYAGRFVQGLWAF
jgi:hypothetical protein